jgi:hypothetical protein
VIQQSEVRILELEIQRLRIAVETAKGYLDALTLKAPRSGLLLRANSRITGTKYQIGDLIWGNMAVATMPDYQEMKTKILASEADFKMISVNDSVRYTFDAMPGNRGSGKITKKMPVGQPYKRGSNVKFFEIEASMERVDTLPEPGFTANCYIILKRMENVISIPQIALFDEDSMKVVYVQRKRGYEKREVTTDFSSLKGSVINAGVTEGEVIALTKPKPSLVKEVVLLPQPDSLTKKLETNE